MRDGDLVQIVDAAMAEAARRAGPLLVCRPGCTECCIGPFPITALDAVRLADGLAQLHTTDPARARSVRARARAAVEEMAPAFPGDPESGMLDCDDAAEEEFCSRFETLPCPALDPSTGLCELYEFRPITCRTFGPPVRFGDEEMPHCQLCFRESSAADITRCTIDVDPEDLEGQMLDDLGSPAQTLVAFALLA